GLCVGYYASAGGGLAGSGDRFGWRRGAFAFRGSVGSGKGRCGPGSQHLPFQGGGDSGIKRIFAEARGCRAFVMENDMETLKVNFSKSPDGLVPAIIQDCATEKVLMLGYMNQDALDRTLAEGKVTFFSRGKQRLWTKGEESGNFLLVRHIALDCDQDTLLVKAEPLGPVCHTGADTCWDEKNHREDFLAVLEEVIQQRRREGSPDTSHIARLFSKGINKIAQKVR